MKASKAMSVLGLLVLLVLPGMTQAGAASSPSTLRVGVVGVPYSTFMQSTTVGLGTWTQFPYLYCYAFGFAGVAMSDLCHPPVATPNTNDTQYTINLISPNLKWSDGVPINSTDLAYSYGIYLSNGPYANLSAFDIWGNLRGTVTDVKVLNSTAIQINTAQPDPLFAMLTWLYPVYPYHFFKQFTGNNTLQTTPIFGGPGDTPYVPVGATPNSNLVNAVANPYSPSWNGTTPKIQNVQIQIFSTDSAVVNALAAGQLDSSMITSSDAQTLVTVPGISTVQLPSNYQMEFFINPDPGVYPYNNTAFRQALMTLVPKVQINELLYNNQSILGNDLLLSPQAYSTYWPGASTPTYDYNATAAQALLQQAGLTKNTAGNWAMKNGTVLTVQFVAPNSDPDIVRAAQLTTTAMQNVGLKVNLQIQDYNTVITEKYSPPDTYHVVLFPDSFFPSPFKWMRNPVNLPSAFLETNTSFNAVYGKALTTADPAAALTLLKQALSILANSAVTNSILYEPLEAAYNSGSFGNWQPALNYAGNFNVFSLPVLSENVLASVTPIGSGSSSSTTSAVSTSSVGSSGTSTATSTTSSSSSSLAIGFPVALGIGVVAAFVVAVFLVTESRRVRIPGAPLAS